MKDTWIVLLKREINAEINEISVFNFSINQSTNTSERLLSCRARPLYPSSTPLPALRKSSRCIRPFLTKQGLLALTVGRRRPGRTKPKIKTGRIETTLYANYWKKNKGERNTMHKNRHNLEDSNRGWETPSNTGHEQNNPTNWRKSTWLWGDEWKRLNMNAKKRQWKKRSKIFESVRKGQQWLRHPGDRPLPESAEGVTRHLAQTMARDHNDKTRFGELEVRRAPMQVHQGTIAFQLGLAFSQSAQPQTVPHHLGYFFLAKE